MLIGCRTADWDLEYKDAAKLECDMKVEMLGGNDAVTGYAIRLNDLYFWDEIYGERFEAEHDMSRLAEKINGLRGDA